MKNSLKFQAVMNGRNKDHMPLKSVNRVENFEFVSIYFMGSFHASDENEYTLMNADFVYICIKMTAGGL